jgi:hypothetical protein
MVFKVKGEAKVRQEKFLYFVKWVDNLLDTFFAIEQISGPSL